METGLNQKQIDDIIELRRNDLRYATIADLLEVPVEAVQFHVRDYVTTWEKRALPPPPPPDLLDRLMDGFKALLDRGKTRS